MSQHEIEEMRLAAATARPIRTSDRNSEAVLAAVIDGLLVPSRAAHPRFSVPAQVLFHWERAMGPMMARRVQPLRFVGTTLHVKVADSETARQLETLEQVLLQQLCALSAVKVTAFKILSERAGNSRQSVVAQENSRLTNELSEKTNSYPRFDELPLVSLGTPWSGS